MRVDGRGPSDIRVHGGVIAAHSYKPHPERLLAINGVAFHNYGEEPRVGSKLGHCTILRTGARDIHRALADALKLVEWT
jgi:phosphoribosylaminoimidazole carboxylase (NCAIR synthetase)